jgi:LCP family protein required for cell wall assembly
MVDVEAELRRTFQRHEHLVVDPAALRPAIDAAASRRRVHRRVLAASGLAVLVLVALAIPTGIRAWSGHPAALLPLASSNPAPLKGRPLNFLIAGLDDSSLVGSTSDHVDTVIVAHVPADRSRLYLITIPRDTWVDDGSGKQLKLDDTYSTGGFPELARAVGAMTGLTFDGAATIGLSGLSRLTDAIGGVDFCVDFTVTSTHTGQRFTAGCHHFTGAQATDYLRERRNFTNVPATDPAGPFGAIIRDRHQVDYLRAVLAKLTEDSTLTDAAKLARLLGTAGTGLVVDTHGVPPLTMATELRPAIHDVVGLAAPFGTNVMHDGFIGWASPPEAGQLFIAVQTDQLASWLTTHPDVLDPGSK